MSEANPRTANALILFGSKGANARETCPTPPAETATAHHRHRWPYAVGAGVRPCALFGKPLMRTRTDVRLSASPRRPQEAERPIYEPFRKIHGMERPNHGLFFSFHGMFRIENRPRFVTYSGKKAHPGRPFRLSPRIGISLSGSSHFCMETAEDESAQKYRILHVKKKPATRLSAVRRDAATKKAGQRSLCERKALTLSYLSFHANA